MKVKRWQHNTHSRGAHLHNTRSVRVVSAAVMLRSIRSNGRLTQIQRASVWNVDMKNDQWIGWESLVVEHARPVSRSQLTYSLVGTRCFLFKAAISIFNNRTTEQMLSPLFGCWPFVPFDRTDVRLFVTFFFAFCIISLLFPVCPMYRTRLTSSLRPTRSDRIISFYFRLRRPIVDEPARCSISIGQKSFLLSSNICLEWRVGGPCRCFVKATRATRQEEGEK